MRGIEPRGIEMREIEASPMRSGYCDCCEGLNRDQIVKIARFTGCKNFVGKRKKFIINAFADLKPVERFENESDVSRFRSLNNSTSKRVLDMLEPVKLIVWKAVIERVTVIEFRMDNACLRHW